MSISPSLLEKAVRIHGHLGPFLVLGMKMCLLAERLLGGNVQRCEIEVLDRKPYLCAVDGIKAVMDNGAVTIRKGTGIIAIFKGVKNGEVALAVKSNVQEKYANEPWELCEDNAFKVLSEDDEDLFEALA
mgnify:FL=1